MQAPTAQTLLHAWERGLLLSPTRRALALLATALPDAEPAQLAALPLGARDNALLRLREALFGDAVAAAASCPHCAAALDVAFRTGDVAGPNPDTAVRRLEEHHAVVDFRLPSSADVLAVASLDDADSLLLQRCVVGASIDGEPVEASSLPRSVAESLARAIDLADPQACTELSLACPECGHAWNAGFDIASFLWTEVAALAQRTLREVHQLAGAYGWAEHDILAMSATRRQLYLEMAAS